ncbi:putative pentatricopeptide repeat-containing protein At5g06400, mitochondrial [Olea europaea var. sylvestris]|uniref:putative pentatricopeptide repeat-containing protein At5g06400, mitochondrial n=1 Tax=Olea europaea var. sylvestris TaxID=158386 RepID=UPI000C1D2758|nr:putative pentatricopeptide repeat-containing protein At5g06400, mitochondrial [Olea europaea var. sylvestris]
MRNLFRRGFLRSASCNNLLNNDRSDVAQEFYFSILSNKSSSRLQNKKNIDTSHTRLKNQRENMNFGPLFNEILGILGTENLTTDENENSSGFSVFQAIQSAKKETVVKAFDSLQGVCENTGKKMEKRNVDSLSRLEDAQMEILSGNELIDVSPVVHQITGIVRGKNGVVSMEEKLKNADFRYTEEIVDKVLKRCFKVPHLALRFFNWLKLEAGFQHTIGTYNTMIYIAGEAKELALVEELLQEMEMNSCEKNVKTWTILMSHYGKAKLIGKGLLIFEKMKKNNVEPDGMTYRIMLRALCTAGEANIALEFYKEMVNKEMELDLSLYKQLLKCLALSGDAAAVRVVGDDMIRVSEIPKHHAYGLMLKSFCIAGRIREALELIRDLKNKNIDLDSESFETLVKGLCRADRIEDAVEIVEIMKKRNIFYGNVYGILINTYLRRNDVSKAFNLFHEIKHSGRVTVSTYTNLMQHLFQKNEFEKALELYEEMIETGIELDGVALTAVAAGYVRQNCISDAWKVFKSMEEKGIKATPKSYAVYIKELCKVSATDEIIKALNEMQASEIIIGDNIFTQLLSHMDKKGELGKLEEIKRMLTARKFCPAENETPNTELCSQPESSAEFEREVEHLRLDHYLPEAAFKSFSEHSKHYVREVCQILSSSKDWCFIQEKLEQCSVQFTTELVVEILRNCSLYNANAIKFFTWVGMQTGYSHNTESYNIAMKVAGQGKNFKQMKTLFYEMRRKGCEITSDTWTIIIMLYGRTGLTDIALNNFREMKSSGCKPTKSSYKYLIISLCGKKGRKVDEAIQIYQEMIQVGCIPDKELLETYLGCLCEVNKLSDARSCIESLREFGCFSVPLTYSLYIRALCRAGKMEEALSLTNEVRAERNTLDQYTYGSLVHGLLRRGRLEEALEKMESMKQVGIRPTVHVYTALLVHFLGEKQINKALETFEEMKKAGCQPTIVTYSSLICGYVRMGKITAAWNVFHEIKQNGPCPDFKTYTMFITCLCRVGKSEEALKLISEMLDDGIVPSTVNFRTVIYGLNREGKQNLAQIILQKKLDIQRRRKILT